MALGAQRASALRSVLARGLRLILAGILLGVLLSYVTGQLLARQISGVSVRDPLTLALATMVVAGLVACYLPARRTTRVDPLGRTPLRIITHAKDSYDPPNFLPLTFVSTCGLPTGPLWYSHRNTLRSVATTQERTLYG